MFRVGVDLVEIERIIKGCKNPRFLNRVYSEAEQQLFWGAKPKYDSLAGNWAAKEAFSKSLGTGVRDFDLTDVEILRDDLGAPFIRLSGRAERIADEMGLSFSVSITHTRQLAEAVVIAYSGKRE